MISGDEVLRFALWSVLSLGILTSHLRPEEIDLDVDKKSPGSFCCQVLVPLAAPARFSQ